MNVVFRVAGQIKVYNHVNVGYVETTTGDIGSDQDRPLLGFEFIERAESLGLERREERDGVYKFSEEKRGSTYLTHLAMKRDRSETQVSEQERDSLGVVTGVSEDDKRIACELI